jgi:hypothetical protein
MDYCQWRISEMTPPTNGSRESKYKLWTAIITLLSVVFGFAYTTFQLLGQRDDLRRIEQNFQSMNQLIKALMMPLEGVWDYKVKYATYLRAKSLLKLAI